MRDAAYPELKTTHTMARAGRPFTDYKPPAAAPVWAVIEGYGRFHTLVAAIELGVFDALEQRGPSTGDALAEELGVSPPHLTTLLEGVVATGLLDRRHGRFEMNDTARRYLTTDGPASMAALVPVSPGPMANWSGLADTVRRGGPAAPIEHDPAAFYVPLVEGTFTTILRLATRADLQLRYSALPSPRVLDLGAGGAPWTIAVLTANPGATAVVNDLPGVIGVAGRKLAERDLLDRVEFLTGDFHEVEVDDGSFDLVVLGHVCRTEGLDGTRRLVERAHDALAPGGRLVLSDYFVDRQRSLASHALMMGVTMMASTERGVGLGYGEVADILRDTGFEAVRLVEPIGFQQLFVAFRRSSATPSPGA
jgi:SAM-dependent methyltransferase